MNELTCTSWSSPACSLEEVGEMAWALSLDDLDLDLIHESALDCEAPLDSPAALADEAPVLAIKAKDLYRPFGAIADDRHPAKTSAPSENAADSEKVIRYSEAVDTPPVMVLAGAMNGAKAAVGREVPEADKSLYQGAARP